MSKMNVAFNMFEKLFDGKYDPFDFSCDMEQYLFDNYNDLLLENKEITDIWEENVPDLCSEGEPNFDPAHMSAELKKIYDKTKAMINQI